MLLFKAEARGYLSDLFFKSEEVANNIRFASTVSWADLKKKHASGITRPNLCELTGLYQEYET